MKEAEQSYRKAISLDPKAISAWGNLGNLCRDLGRNKDAEHAYRKALEINPNAVEFWQGLAAALGRQGRHDENAAALERAIALAPGRADIVCDSRHELRCRGNNPEAAAFSGVRWKSPRLRPSARNLGALLLRASQIVAAKHPPARMERAPREPRWVSNLGVTQKDMGNFAEAERLYRRAFEMKPDYSLGHANLLFCLNYHPDPFCRRDLRGIQGLRFARMPRRTCPRP